MEYRISVVVNGVKKRARKTARHIIQIKRVPFDGVNKPVLDDALQSEVIDAVNAELKDLNATMIVHFDLITFNGPFEQWEPFSNENYSVTMEYL